MNRCPVCDGRRKVTLRHQPPFQIMEPGKELATIALTTSKDYPCPECSPHTSEDKVEILTFGCEISSRGFDDPGYFDAAKDNVASQLAYELSKKGMIRFVVDQPVGDREPFAETHLRGTIGVVSPKVVASMQDRIRANNIDVAREMAEEAIQAVRVWGSRYTGDEGIIAKGQTVTSIYGAMKRVQERYKKYGGSKPSPIIHNDWDNKP